MYYSGTSLLQVDTLRTAISVLISEVSTLEGEFYFVYIHVAGNHNSALIKEVSLFEGCPFRGLQM